MERHIDSLIPSEESVKGCSKNFAPKTRENAVYGYENGHLGSTYIVPEKNTHEVTEKLETGVQNADKIGTACDTAQRNGEIFSPDSSDNMTLNGSDCKKEAEGGKMDKDEYDTQSDSIGTLEDDSPCIMPQGSPCDSLMQQINLTDSGTSQKEFVPKQVSVKAKCMEDLLSTTSDVFSSESESSANAVPSRPESLSLPRSLELLQRQRSTTEPKPVANSGEKTTIRDEAFIRHQRTRSEAIDIQGVRVRGDLGYGDDVLSKSLPHGTIMRKGDLIEFVADDLQEKIKRSSPMSNAGSMGSRRSSERSVASLSSATSASSSIVTSSGLSRSPSSLLTQSPDAAPPIDPGAIMELEVHARRVADSVDHMMGNLRANLHKMSAITVGCLEAYKTSVDITCDSVDSSIKSMYALMAKCEELSKTMGPVHQIGAQIKEIKRLLDLFEAQLQDKS